MWSRIALRRARRAVVEAQSLFADSRWDAAGTLFEDARKRLDCRVSTHPEAAELAARADLGLGRIHLTQGRFPQALAAFQTAQSLWPQGWEAWYWAGCALGHQQAYAEAEASFTAALQRQPGSGPARIQRAYARFRRGGDAGAPGALPPAQRQGDPRQGAPAPPAPPRPPRAGAATSRGCPGAWTPPRSSPRPGRGSPSCPCTPPLGRSPEGTGPAGTRPVDT